jgi:hypothetical protein
MGAAKRRAMAAAAGTPWPQDQPRGELTILNVGTGDTKLIFDKSKPAEVKRAGRVVQDMLRRGFALLVEVGERNGQPLYQRAHSFDPETNEYLIVGTPDDAELMPKRRSAKPKFKRLPATSTKATAVARSAGG